MTDEKPIPEHATIRCEHVKCGKANCSNCANNGATHGPYYYAYWREEGKLKKKYIGSHLPAGLADYKTRR